MDRSTIMKYYNKFSAPEFDETYFYEGNDLGAVWTKEKTSFRLWAPTAEKIILNLYETGDREELPQQIPMVPDIRGTWVVTVARDLNGIYYTYSVTVEGETREAVDPYAKAVGVNGNRGMVINLSSTAPENFATERRPGFISPTDAIIYEIHVRDFSQDESSGMKNKGKYLAFTELGTKNSYSDKTGVDHLKELGVTHVHLLPVFDFATVDETMLEKEQFNWGYDPKNYNVPEGSYSTDPYHGEVRIREFKQMIQALHQNGIRVIMDVVYNHTYNAEASSFHKTVPGYYYRMTPEGNYSDASACGNETASERAMMRKFILDSVVYWAEEYHIDGFRFDLMGVHDIQTMNELRQTLDRIDPSILLYGEGWTGGTSILPLESRAMKANMLQLDSGIAAFSDDLRDGIKGSVFNAEEQGYVSGKDGMEDTIKFGIVASTYHTQINYQKVNYSKGPWAKEPTQTINYVSAHDNLTLWDKLVLSNPGVDSEDRIRMNLLSAAILLTSQGIPFFQAGEEFLRSKPLNEEEIEFDENSYQSSDLVNSIKWDRKHSYKEVFDYYAGLIAFRKAHKILHFNKAEDIRRGINFLSVDQAKLIAYTVEGPSDRKDNKHNTICIIYNANREAKTVSLPKGEWEIYVKGKQAGNVVLEILKTGVITVEPISAAILIQS